MESPISSPDASADAPLESAPAASEGRAPRRRRRDAEREPTPALPGPPPARYRIALPEEHMDPDAVKVIKRLTRHGHIAYLVGGGVRDLLLGRRPKDFDVATSARPGEVRKLFRNCRIIGRRFRLAHILFGDGKIIETATFRRDPTQELELLPYPAWPSGAVKGGGRPVKLAPRRDERAEEQDLLIRNDNVFGHPYEDAIRRDFTINGLFYDFENGEVIDYVGGMPDLRGRVVRTIGDPDVRFREDPVRILRAVKFSARIDMGIDPEVYDAMVDFRHELGRAARPRLLEELLRFLRGSAAHRSIYLAWDLGVLHVMLPEVAAFLDDDAPGTAATWGRLEAIDRMVAVGTAPSDAVLLAALLLGPLEEALDGVRDPSSAFEDFMDDLALRLAVPRRLKDRLRLLVTSQRRLRSGKVGTLARREFFPDAARLHAIDAEGRGRPVPEWARSPEQVETEEAPRRRRRRRRRRRSPE